MNNHMTTRYNPDAYATCRHWLTVILAAIGGGLFIGGGMALVYIMEGLFG
jgi:uncharacterized membrane-anchored protein YitT (DUF2179 family)